MADLCEVMVVDDNEDAAAMLSELVACMGCRVEVANDGFQALAKLASFHPRIVFLDIGMPGMDGFELARKIRCDAANCSAYLVAVSGWGDAETIERGRAAGIDLHVQKPICLELINSTLARCSP